MGYVSPLSPMPYDPILAVGFHTINEIRSNKVCAYCRSSYEKGTCPNCGANLLLKEIVVRKLPKQNPDIFRT